MSDTRLWDHHQNENRSHLQDGYHRQDRIKKTIENLTKTGTILEIGFWDGYLLSNLSDMGYTTIGQDLSEKNIELTKKQWPEASTIFLLWGEDGKLLVEDESIDVFVASEVLEHMSDSELENTVSEIKRVLKPGWHAVITFPFQEDLAKMTQFCPHCEKSFHKWWHKQNWNDEKIMKVFSWFADIQVKRFFSLMRRHRYNPIVRLITGMLEIFFSLFSRNILPHLSSNYFIILEK